MPRLKEAALQFAIFSEDPAPRFTADLERLAGVYEAQLRRHGDDLERRKRARLIQLGAVWNSLFRRVTGDAVYLISKWAEELLSNEPAGRKWLVTKVAQIGGQPYCWNVPFDAVAARLVEIELSEANALVLANLDKNQG